MRIVVICSGTIEDANMVRTWATKADFILCADGGAGYAKWAGVTPDLLIGDFDSIEPETKQFFIEKQIHHVQFPVAKDMTDSELAVDFALTKNPTEIILLGAIGSRLDHSIANIFLLKNLLDKNVNAAIVNEKNEIRLIKDTYQCKRREATKVSLIPLFDKVEGITTKGLLYELRGETLPFGSTRGVSNEFCMDEAEISVDEGYLMLLLSEE